MPRINGSVVQSGRTLVSKTKCQWFKSIRGRQLNIVLGMRKNFTSQKPNCLGKLCFLVLPATLTGGAGWLPDEHRPRKGTTRLNPFKRVAVFLTFYFWVLSSMDRMPCFELGDVGSIPAGPANTL